MNYNVYRKAKIIESLALLIVSIVMFVVWLNYLINPREEWGIIGVIVELGAIILMWVSMHLFALSLHSFLTILSYKQKIGKCAGYVTGVVAKFICFFLCVSAFKILLEYDKYLVTIIFIVICAILLVAIINDFRLIAFIKRTKAEEDTHADTCEQQTESKNFEE